MTTPTILRPAIAVSLTVDGASVDILVRELPWQDAIAFLKMLSTHAHQLIQANGGTLSIDAGALLPKLTDLIGSSEELVNFLLTRSTGKPLAEIGALGTGQTLALLAAALEVNLSDQLLELGKKVGGRLARVMPARMAPTTSSTPASPTS